MVMSVYHLFMSVKQRDARSLYHCDHTITLTYVSSHSSSIGQLLLAYSNELIKSLTQPGLQKSGATACGTLKCSFTHTTSFPRA
jgi:hypothetical protein